MGMHGWRPAGAAAACGVAAAAAALALGTADVVAQDNERIVIMDEVSLEIFAETQRTLPRTYELHVAGMVWGANQNDAVLLEWFKGRRKLAEQRCTVQYRERIDCAISGDLSTTGAHRLKATLIDQNSDERFVALEAEPVIETARTMERQGDRDVHVPVFYVNHDDRMGLAYVHNANVMNVQSGIALYFWRSDLRPRNPQYNFRCKHGEDGEWQGFPARSSFGDPRTTNRRGSLMQRQLVVTRVYDDRRRTEERGEHLWWRERVEVGFPVQVTSRHELVETPVAEGVWDCQFREDGVVVRGVRLYVNGSGQLMRPPSQVLPGGIPVANAYYRVLNLFFPDQQTWGDSFDPAAMRRSFGYGRSWPMRGEGLEAEFEALPSGRRAKRAFEFPRPPRGVPNGDRARRR